MKNVFEELDPSTPPASGAAASQNVFEQLDPATEAQGARDAAAVRVRGRYRNVPRHEREAPSSAWDDVTNVTRRILPAANTSLAETAGRALDVVPYFVSRIMGASPEEAVHPIENFIKNFQVPNAVPLVGGQKFVPDVGPAQSSAQSMADAGGKMLGETAPFSLGLAKLFSSMAKPAVEAAPGVANAFRGAFQGAGEAMVRKPLTSTLGEGVAALESGAVGDAMRQKSQESGDSEAVQHTKEQSGQIIGPTALQLAPTAIANKLAAPLISGARRGVEAGAKIVGEAIPESIRPAWVDTLAQRGAEERLTAARGAVGEKLKGALATPESQANLLDAERLQNEIPGFKPGIARATGDPELLNVQQSRDIAAVGDDLRARRETFDSSKTAIAGKLETVVPAAGQYPQDSAVATGARRIKGITSKIEGQKTATEGKLREQADSLPQIDRIEGGDALRESRSAAARAMDDETTRLRGKIGGANTPLEIKAPVQPVVETPYGVAGSEAAQKMTLNQILDRRAEINQQMRDYSNATSRSVADTKAMRELSVERNHLDNVVKGLNNPGLREYTNHYKSQNVPQFRQGASAEVGRRDSLGYGGNKVDSEKVAGKFFNPNEESAAKQFDTAMGHDPGTRQQMVDHALDDIRHNGVDPVSQTIKKGFVNKWLQKNERVLAQMPQTGPEIRAAVSAKNPDALYERIGQLEQRRRGVANSKLASALERVAGPGQAPENAIHAAIKDPKLMTQVMNSARGDPAAQAAVRRSVFDAVRKQSPDVLAEPEKFLSWMKENNRSLSRVLTPQHKSDLEIVARAAMIQNSLGRPEGTVAVTKSIVGRIEDALGITVGSAASTGRGVAQGRTSPAIEGISQGAKFFNRQAARASAAAWDEALANPEAAKLLVGLAKGKATPMQSARLYTYLISSGMMRSESDEDRP